MWSPGIFISVVGTLRRRWRSLTIIESNSRQLEIEKIDTSMTLLDQSLAARSGLILTRNLILSQ
jgi:hypothetical protein